MKVMDLTEVLKGNVYPGRGIVAGKTEDGMQGVLAYFIMGRSVNSRNRVFVQDDEGLRTQAYDPALLSDPSLVIYAPVRRFAEQWIVTNGDQTDTIYEYLSKGKSFEEALRTRTFEPDPPNFTPRISLLADRADGFSYRMSILKSADGDPQYAQRFFYEYTAQKGMAHFIHTYRSDGNPRIPSFEGEPEPVRISGSIDAFTENVWSALNAENKISLFVRYIDLNTGEYETRILNKNQ